MAFIDFNERLRYTKNEAERLAQNCVFYQAAVNVATS